MKKVLIALLLSPVLVHAKVPDLPSYPLALKQVLGEPLEDAQDKFEQLPYYRLIKAVQDNVYFLRNTASIDATYNEFTTVYQSADPVLTKINILTDTVSSKTVPGIGQQFLEALKSYIY